MKRTWTIGVETLNLSVPTTKIEDVENLLSAVVYDFSEDGASLVVYTEETVTEGGSVELDESTRKFGLVCGGGLLTPEINDIKVPKTDEIGSSPSRW